MEAVGTIEGRFVIPKDDIGFFKALAKKMGWTIEATDITHTTLMNDIELSLYQAKDMSKGRKPRTHK